MTVTIVKTKFAADIACFGVDQQASEEAEEIDANICAMTSQRNHSTWTVNRAHRGGEKHAVHAAVRASRRRHHDLDPAPRLSLWRPAPLKAARTKAFRAYAYRLAATGDLGQIVLDEAHFTVTASEYRAAMVDLALIRGAQFELQNNLVNPKIIRASTNRRNLFYMVERVARPGQLLKEGARRAKDAWEGGQLLDRARDKIIVYARTKEDAATLAGLLCYTADVGTAERKGELLRTWLLSPDQPYIVATSALSAGFDYAHADEDATCDICSAGPARAPSPAAPAVPALQPTGGAAIREKRRLANLELS
ncbi:hypothetical protein V502_02219 [Pseudogymnoascus sp. VKM F-4520 (FW-2644)]|nr:hypothetical protein V502_02219 [Pseudogymnoascus sp. VKM F-4520 (FW-2644)]